MEMIQVPILTLVMISVEEACKIIFSHPWNAQPEQVNLLDATGRVLAEDVKADRDLPPFERVAMDGIAVKYSDLSKGIRTFRRSGTAIAGQPGIALGCIKLKSLHLRRVYFPDG